MTRTISFQTDDLSADVIDHHGTFAKAWPIPEMPGRSIVGLMGFAPSNIGFISTLDVAAFWVEPDRAIGSYPIYDGADGALWRSDKPVTRIALVDGEITEIVTQRIYRPGAALPLSAEEAAEVERFGIHAEEMVA